MSKTWTTPPEFALRSNRASATKRSRMSRRYDQLSAITFTATSACSRSSWASHTTAKAPVPRRRSTRYRPISSGTDMWLSCMGDPPASPAGPTGGHPPVTRPADGTEALAIQASGGDQAALDALLRDISPDVLRRCARFLLYREDAEEAAQDVLVQVARNIHRFEGRSKFSTWLYTVVANCSRQKYRELKRRSAETPLTTAETTHPDPRTTSVIAGSRVDLLEALERLEREAPQLVTPLIYRDICELDYAEIADRMNLPVGTVKSRLHRARQQVRPWLIGGDTAEGPGGAEA